MDQYTELLKIKAETLSPEEDDYEEKLREIAALFRGFDEALTAFIEKHGYTGELTDVPAKAKFFREKFKAAAIKPPRDFKEWFVPNKKVTRNTAYQICFALGLDAKETEDFFSSVQLERDFDCHTISEAVYYFCMNNSLPYSEACEIIDRIPTPKKGKVIPDSEILYTKNIEEYIKNIGDKEKLIQYITDNIDGFQYNNAKAIKSIQELWTKISKKAESPADEEEEKEYNLAVKEGRIIDKSYNRFQDRSKRGETDTRSKDVIEEQVKREEEMKLDDRVIAEEGASTWTIIAQIIGLDNKTESKYATKYDRSLTSVFAENELMPLKAAFCFPNRQNIDKLFRGEIVNENEIVRKILILLAFYNYWARIITDEKNAFYSAKHSDSEDCLANINNRLINACYPELYAGNPYDWLFMWALNDEHPLDAFRTYMSEVFAVKKEQSDNTE